VVGRSGAQLTGLRGALAGASPDPIDASLLPWLLKLPWCWPDGEASVQLEGLTLGPPPSPKPGEVLLVSATPNERKGGLWQLRRWNSTELHEVALRPLAASLEVRRVELESAVTLHLPLVLNAAPLRGTGPWYARRVYTEGLGRAEVLVGPSYELALSLALASLYMQTPVSARWLASAAVGPDGELTRVDGLGDKLSIATRWAPGVTGFLVAAEQEDEARALAVEIGAPLAIVGISRLDEAFDRVFPGLRAEGPTAWSDPKTALAAARRLARIATAGPALRDWGAVERPARILAERLPTGSEGHEHATWALAIALRHQGQPAPLPWFDIEADPERAAHRLQAAADVGSDELPVMVERARELLRHGGPERTLPILLGAIGRAEAALGRYPASLEASEEAVALWRALDQFPEAGRPLCEAVRVAGLTANTERLARLVAEAQALIDGEEHVDGATRSFLRLAIGRAWVLAGSPACALPHLAPETGAPVRADVDWSTRRWRAAALAALGRTDEAAAVRAALFAEEREGTAPIIPLAHLDELLATTTDDETLIAHLSLLARLDPSIDRLRARGGSPREKAQIVAREYAY
jgi:hypothetical protein